MDEAIKMMWEMLKPTCKKRLFGNNYIKFRALMLGIGLKDFDIETFDVEVIDCHDVDTFINSLTKVLKRNNEYDGYDEEEILRNIEYLEKDNSLSNIDITNKIDILSSTIQLLQTLKDIKLYNLRMRLI
jgi:hypothetical protein